jgi:pentatricopeptide repeat protein
VTVVLVNENSNRLKFHVCQAGNFRVENRLMFAVTWQGYSRSDNPLEALKLMDEMRSHNLQPQRVTFNSLILACVRGGDLQRALKLLSLMKVCTQL